MWYKIKHGEMLDDEDIMRLVNTAVIKHKLLDTWETLCYFEDGNDHVQLSMFKPLTNEELKEYGIFYIGEQ
jgi:hypothetical protein